jgi:hypothetical protein
MEVDYSDSDFDFDFGFGFDGDQWFHGCYTNEQKYCF